MEPAIKPCILRFSHSMCVILVDDWFRIMEYLGKKLAFTFLLLAIIKQVTAYENAYDLADRRRLRGDYQPFEESERFQDSYWDRMASRHWSPIRIYSNREPDFVTFSSRSVGNGYDNLGNSGFVSFDQRRKFLQPQSDLRERSREWGNFFEESVAPFQSDRFKSTIWEVPEVSVKNVGFRRRHFMDTGKIPLNRPVFYNRRRPTNRPSIFESRRISTQRRPAWTPRSTLVNNLTKRPAFYNRNYFARTDSDPVIEAGYQTDKSDEDFQVASGEADDSEFATTGSLVSSNEDAEEKKTDAGYHDKAQEAVSDVASKEKVGETTRFDKNGGNKSTVRVNRISKKGHTTRGFATHHHKDETGNTTTFFDESSDTGGQEDYQDTADEFGTRKTLEILNGREDGKFLKENGGRVGQYGSGSLHDHTKIEKDIIAKKNQLNEGKAFENGKDKIDRGFKTEKEYLGSGIWSHS